jgi:hypothetical protein
LQQNRYLNHGLLANWNNDPKPFTWKSTADIILDKVRRCKEAIVKT